MPKEKTRESLREKLATVITRHFERQAAKEQLLFNNPLTKAFYFSWDNRCYPISFLTMFFFIFHQTTVILYLYTRSGSCWCCLEHVFFLFLFKQRWCFILLQITAFVNFFPGNGYFLIHRRQQLFYILHQETVNSYFPTDNFVYFCRRTAVLHFFSDNS